MDSLPAVPPSTFVSELGRLAGSARHSDVLLVSFPWVTWAASAWGGVRGSVIFALQLNCIAPLSLPWVDAKSDVKNLEKSRIFGFAVDFVPFWT